MKIVFLKIRPALQMTGLSRSHFYNTIKDGLMPPPVKIAVKSAAWVEHELDAVNRARVAGKSEDEIRALVSSLVIERANA